MASSPLTAEVCHHKSYGQDLRNDEKENKTSLEAIRHESEDKPRPFC